MADTRETADDDNRLMIQIQAGDHQAFVHLVNRHTERFYAVAYRMLGDTGQAEDSVQDAFLKLWDNPELFDPSRNVKFTTWFYRVVANVCIDIVRKRNRVSASDILDQFADDQDLQDKTLEQKQQQAYLEEAIQALPDKQKMALNLCFYEGISNKEAAEIMGIKVKALESLLMRAKAGLRQDLIRQGIVQEKEHA